VVDGLELPAQPRHLLEAAQFHQVPTLVGFNRDEGVTFVNRSFQSGASLAQYHSWLGTEFGGLASSVLGQYPGDAFPLPSDTMSRIVGDGQFVCEGRRFARALTDRHTPVYFYSYEYEIDDVFPDKVIHGVESNILFGNAYVPNQFPNRPLNDADLALHVKMAGYWSRFAATGNPNIEDPTVVHWNGFHNPLGNGRGANRYLVIDSTIRSEKRLREAACDFWEPHFLRSMLGRVPAGG
jgi:para-nitrobenzyl esterase